jgi:pimeloyl-ACP methyl ester carboxylesterase
MPELTLRDGRTLVVHDSATGDALTLIWHHGTPQTGALLEPVVEHARRRGIRVISYARPGYGGSTPQPGRAVADAGRDVREIADQLGLQRFAPWARRAAALTPWRAPRPCRIASAPS